MSIWDHKVKKRLRQYPKYRTAIPSVAFNCDGTKLAIGISYTWDNGEEGAKTAERPGVFVKTLGEEVKVSCVYVLGLGTRLMLCVLAKGLERIIRML